MLNTKVAITFDVEKHNLTQSDLLPLLDLLDQHEIKATFFVIGRLADRSPSVPKAIISQGHELGCHGYVHDPYDKRKFTDVKTDVKRGSKAIREFGEVVGFRAPYFRPHIGLAAILEAFDYQYDSSVPSKRFDLFVGRTNNPYNLFAPREPYHPSRTSIFKKGDSPILEIPLSSFVFSPLGVIMRNLGLAIFTKFTDFLSLFSNPIIFDIHIWEFLEEPLRPGKRQTIFFHRRKKGKETTVMFNSLLHHFKQMGTFVPLSDLITRKKKPDISHCE